MAEPQHAREQVFVKLPHTVDDTLSLPELEKVNKLLFEGYYLISVNQSVLRNGDIGISFVLGKDAPTEHMIPLHRG